jgi:hypothetical protein
MTEAEALEKLEVWRWKTLGPQCPICGDRVRRIPSRPGNYRCDVDIHQFSVTSRTPFNARKKSLVEIATIVDIMEGNCGITPMEFARRTRWSYKAAHTFIVRWRAWVAL